ncbi:MAG: asparagine synthase (glutamine-hydrolyzing) [Rubrivivax sp.]|nr:asparagine synthase (glutamine-hydrolyzing) [Rubrivivax sp.]HRI91226.1 asparagine synthase (glutamine-hydrolyzing) [Accumulibacter sp.]
MCGIVGRVSDADTGSLRRALDVMRHRGPDAAAERHFTVRGRHIALGHRRLSILDLSEAANQPFVSASGRWVIVFNGEIYNHASLRLSLQSEGVRFRTRSDTEVLLAGIELHGDAFLSRLNGMFAFAALEIQTGRMLLARDPFGIKPLYFARLQAGGMAFASEIRSLLTAARLPALANAAMLPEFLLNGFLYETATGLERVEKVAPGTLLTFDPITAEVRSRRFYDPLASLGLSCSTEEFDAIIDLQLGLEVEADVPVGVFFSGGIDSSVLAAAAPKGIEPIFVDYGDADSGDARHARDVATSLGLDLRTVRHVETEISADDIEAEFRAVAAGTEEPISDYTFAATRAISRHARELGFKVMLSGMGGDELFAGYPRHHAARRWPLLHAMRWPLGGAARLLNRLPAWSKRADRLAWFAAGPDFLRAYTSLVGYFSSGEVAALLGRPDCTDGFFKKLEELARPVAGMPLLRQAMYLDRFGFLAHNLTVTDRASMAESIEVRVPLLTPKLESLSLCTEDFNLIRGRQGKQPLREYLYRRIPRSLVDRAKVGFNPPLDGRISRLGPERCIDLLCYGPLVGVVDTSLVRRWLSEHFAGTRNHTYRIWQLLYLGFWLARQRETGGTAVLTDHDTATPATAIHTNSP